MMGGYYASAGSGAPAPTYAVPAGAALQHVDGVVGQLGKPQGVAVYRPFGSLGEDFLPSFLGMMGIPIDLQPHFPSHAHTVLLTQDAAADPKIVDLIESQVREGGNVIITSGLLGKLQSRGIDRIANLYLTGQDALVKLFLGGSHNLGYRRTHAHSPRCTSSPTTPGSSPPRWRATTVSRW